MSFEWENLDVFAGKMIFMGKKPIQRGFPKSWGIQRSQMFGIPRWDWISTDGSQSKAFPGLGYLSSHRIPVPIPGIHSFPFLLELHRNPGKSNPGEQIPWNSPQTGQEVKTPNGAENPDKSQNFLELGNSSRIRGGKIKATTAAPQPPTKIQIKAKIPEFRAGIQA